MFSEFGLNFLKKKLFTAKESEEGSSDPTVRTIEIELASTNKPAPAQNAARRPAMNKGKSRNVFINVTSRETEQTLTTEIIAERAYEIWKSEGCPAGKHVEHWLRAEKELRS
jgi:hypothetical protein